MADHEEEIKKRDTTIVANLHGQNEIPSLPCVYCNTLLKPSDQTCPKCGAPKTKIIDQLDRNVEMEKLKLQEKKKQLRKELKLELQYANYTPFERVYWYYFYRSFGKLAPSGEVRFSEREKEHLSVLDRLIKEDLKKDPDLENRWYDSLTEKQRKMLRVRK